MRFKYKSYFFYLHVECITLTSKHNLLGLIDISITKKK